MQQINKEDNSILVFTLTEKQTITSPYYLFSLRNGVEMEAINFIAYDTSEYPERYNKFLVTETSGTQTLTSGIVTLGDNGIYEYAIYEQTSATNLNPTLADNTTPIEIGFIKVVGTSPTYDEYNEQDNTTITYGD